MHYPYFQAARKYGVVTIVSKEPAHTRNRYRSFAVRCPSLANGMSRYSWSAPPTGSIAQPLVLFTNTTVIDFFVLWLSYVYTLSVSTDGYQRA